MDKYIDHAMGSVVLVLAPHVTSNGRAAGSSLPAAHAILTQYPAERLTRWTRVYCGTV